VSGRGGGGGGPEKEFTGEQRKFKIKIYNFCVLQSLSWLVYMGSGNTKWLGLQDACKKRGMHTKF
jgi:hypothetical protein